MKKNLLYITVLAGVAAIMTACSKDELPNNILDASDSEVHFTGAIKKQSEVLATTRSEETINPDEYDILNADNQEYGTFYIWMDISDNDNTNTEHDFQQYEIASGEQGELRVVDNGEKLNWKNRTSQHTFYSWTQPQVTGEEGKVTGGVNITVDGNINSLDDISGTVTFGTNGETNLEQFIVTKKGPISYNDWGQDVALYYERPISKITLVGVIHVDSQGSTDNTIESCTIEFPNMYKQATFKPANIFNEKNEGNDNDESKVVLTGTDTKWITWNWEKNDNDYKSLYVLPFEFGKDDPSADKVGIEEDPGFFIVKYDNKSYSGTLNSLNLTPDQTEEKRDLKAGEHMQLWLVITDGGGVGIGYTIKEWNTEGLGELPQYRIPGVYNKDDADRLLDALQKAANSSGTYTFPEGVEDLVVETSVDGATSKTYDINLFTHIDWSSVTNGDIKIPDGYTLKGNGYNVTLKNGVNITGKQVENIYVNNRVPGVYSEEEAGRLLKALTATEESEKFPNGVKDLLVGSTINLFCDIDWNDKQISGQITIPDGYSLNGNGYNITLPDGVSITGNDNIKNLYVNGGLYPNENGESNTDESSGSDASENTTP